MKFLLMTFLVLMNTVQAQVNDTTIVRVAPVFPTVDCAERPGPRILQFLEEPELISESLEEANFEIGSLFGKCVEREFVNIPLLDSGIIISGFKPNICFFNCAEKSVKFSVAPEKDGRMIIKLTIDKKKAFAKADIKNLVMEFMPFGLSPLNNGTPYRISWYMNLIKLGPLDTEISIGLKQ